MPAPRVFAVAFMALTFSALFSCCPKPPAAASPSRPPDPAAIVQAALKKKSISQVEIAALITWPADEDIPAVDLTFLNGFSRDELFALMKLLIPHIGEASPDHDNAWWILISMQGTCPAPDVKIWTDWINEQTPRSIHWSAGQKRPAVLDHP